MGDAPVYGVQHVEGAPVRRYPDLSVVVLDNAGDVVATDAVALVGIVPVIADRPRNEVQPA